MPRPLRPIADDLIYHVINRGNGRQAVFHGEGDYLAFLKAIRDLKERRPFALYGYCLMPNHIHLLLRPREATVSRIMQSLLISHTQRYHRRHATCGHVWQGRFKSPVIQDGEHLLCVLRYIEANPVRAKIADHPGRYRWSSYAAHGDGKPDDLLDPVPAYDALAVRPSVRCRRWSAYVTQLPPEHEMAALCRSSETGLPFGGPAWVKRLAKRLHLDLTIRPRGRPRKKSTKPGPIK
jgi:putative transposase